MAQPITLNKTVAWFNKTEGRDKICKVMQYGSRLLMWHLANQGNKEASARFKALFCNWAIGSCEKAVPSGEGIERAAKIHRDHQQKGNARSRQVPGAAEAHPAVPLLVLRQHVRLEHDQVPELGPEALREMGRHLLVPVDGDRDRAGSEGAVHRSAEEGEAEEADGRLISTDGNYGDELKALKKKEFDNILVIIKSFGDFCPAGSMSQIFPNYFKFTLHDGQIGLGGLISGLISAWQAY